MIAASAGEIMACIVRVPAEVIKQRTQASHMGLTSSWSNFKHILMNNQQHGVIRGLYRGWNSTIMREIPFTVIQFPLYEWLKTLSNNSESNPVSMGLRGALCGMVAGGVAAALTTPLDVIKTRIMLSADKVSFGRMISQLIKEEGLSSFWKGVVPRTCWISCGGAIFLGCYELVRDELMRL